MSELKLGLAFSAIFHITLVVVSVIGIPSLKKDFKGIPEPIPVEIVELDDENRVVEREPEPEIPQPKPQAQQQPKPQPHQQSETRVADALPFPNAKPKVPSKKPVKRIEKRFAPKVAPRSKPRPPSKLDMGKIAALIDRSKPKEEVVVVEVSKEDIEKKLEDAVRKKRANTLEARRATATLGRMIDKKISSCWSVLAGAKYADDLVVYIDIFLRPDGTFARAPEILDRDRMFEGGQEFFKTAAEAAVRAVMRCAPFEFPLEQYEEWNKIEAEFDPKNLFGNGE